MAPLWISNRNQNDKEDSMSDMYKRNLIIKQAGKPGKSGKIAAKCIECVYDPEEQGTWRRQVENCTSKGCPLYAVRPKPLAGVA
jgi:hypothetical protein